MRTGLLLLILIITIRTGAQRASNFIRKGNEQFREQKYDQAELQYGNALKQEPTNTTAKFNLANTLYRRGKYEEATKTYGDITAVEKNATLNSKACYNQGVTLSSQHKLEESIEAYKNALRQNPGDIEARENLQKAILELRKKNSAKKKEENSKKKKQEQQQQKKQPQPKMNNKEAEQRLKLLEQKEKEVQQRLQKEKSKTGGSQSKDW